MANQIDNSTSYPRHPDFVALSDEYEIWRDTMNGGDAYIEKYLEQYNTREDSIDFKYRLSMTVNPAFADGAVTDIKNAIFQRFTEIRRIGGDKTYRYAIDGLKGGVDNFGRTMNSFIGDKVLNELIGMGKVGLYIDMPVLDGQTLADTITAKPYIYIYRCEDILNWDYNTDGTLKYVVLNKKKYTYDESNELISDSEYVEVKLTNTEIIENGESRPNELGIIPFVIFELNHGVLRDIAKYQIALMNISSSDINYLIQANFPLYTEQINQNTEIQKFMKKDKVANSDGDTSSMTKGEKVGVRHGRTYPIGSDRPQYIHPSPEPLLASIKKQDQMKEELRQIVALSVSTMRAKMESAESKAADVEGLESGLAAVGSVLEAGERIVAKIWQLYVGSKSEVQIIYPERYEIKDIDKTIKRCKEMLEMIPQIPVLSAQRKLMEKIITLLLSHNVDEETLDSIIEELDKIEIIAIDPDLVNQDVENGLISHELAAKLRHYPKDDLALATKEHADKLKRVAESQLPKDTENVSNPEIRGVPETKTDKGVSVEEKKNKPKRGEQVKKTKGDE